MQPPPDYVCSVHDRQASTIKTGFIFPVGEIVGKMVERAVDEYHQQDMEEASITVADDEPSIACSLPHATGPSKISFSCQSHQELCPIRRRCCSSYRPRCPKKSIWKGRYSILDNKCDKSSEPGSKLSRHLVDTCRHRRVHSSKQSLKDI